MKIYEHDGFIGYFRGLTPRIMRKGLGNILAWGIYEYLVDKRAGVYIDWINVLINKVFNDDAILRKLLIIYYWFTDVIRGFVSFVIWSVMNNGSIWSKSWNGIKTWIQIIFVLLQH